MTVKPTFISARVEGFRWCTAVKCIHKRLSKRRSLVHSSKMCSHIVNGLDVSSIAECIVAGSDMRTLQWTLTRAALPNALVQAVLGAQCTTPRCEQCKAYNAVHIAKDRGR